MTPDDGSPTPTAVDSQPGAPGAAKSEKPAGRPTVFFIDLPQAGSGPMRDVLAGAIAQKHRAWVYERADVDGSVSVESVFRLGHEKKKRLRLVMGHFAWGLQRQAGPWFTYLTMLRDPVERASALHLDYLELERRVRQARGQRDGQPGHEEPTSLEDFVFGQQHLTLDNGFVRALAGRRHVRFGQCPDDLFDEATDHVDRRVTALLLAEDPARSWQIVCSTLGLEDGATAVPTGQGEPQAAPVDPGLARRIRELNRLDTRLLAIAQQRFDEAYERIVG